MFDEEAGQAFEEHSCEPDGMLLPQGPRSDVTVGPADEAQGTPKTGPNCFVLCCCMCACLNSLLLGFDIGVTSSSSLVIRDHFGLTSFQQELIVGTPNLVSIAGALTVGRIADHFGRRRTFSLAAIFFFVGAVLVSSAQDFWMILIGRVVVGLGVGTGLSIDPLYISELSPSHLRGKLVTWSEISINIGILSGYGAGLTFNGLPDTYNWRIMNGLAAIAPIVIFALSVTWMPESPRWLLRNGRKEEAEAILVRACGPDEAATTLRDLETIAEVEAGSWAAIFCNPTSLVKRAVLVGVGVAVCQQISGDESIVLYTPVVLENAGFDSREEILMWTSVIGVFKVAGIFVSERLLDRAGRRVMINISLAGMAVLCTLFALCLQFSAPSVVLVPVLCVYQIFFSVGIGPACWLMASEVFPLHVRGTGMSLATACNRGSSALVAMTFVTLIDVLTLPGVFFLYSTVAVACVTFTVCFVPETKGKSLEQVQLMMSTEPLCQLACVCPCCNAVQNTPPESIHVDTLKYQQST